MVGTSTNNRTIPIISQKEREGGSQKQVRIVTIPIPNIKIPDRRCVRFQTSVLERVQGFLMPDKEITFKFGHHIARKGIKRQPASE